MYPTYHSHEQPDLERSQSPEYIARRYDYPQRESRYPPQYYPPDPRYEETFTSHRQRQIAPTLTGHTPGHSQRFERVSPHSSGSYPRNWSPAEDDQYNRTRAEYAHSRSGYRRDAYEGYRDDQSQRYTTQIGQVMQPLLAPSDYDRPESGGRGQAGRLMSNPNERPPSRSYLEERSSPSLPPHEYAYNSHRHSQTPYQTAGWRSPPYSLHGSLPRKSESRYPYVSDGVGVSTSRSSGQMQAAPRGMPAQHDYYYEKQSPTHRTPESASISPAESAHAVHVFPSTSPRDHREPHQVNEASPISSFSTQSMKPRLYQGHDIHSLAHHSEPSPIYGRRHPGYQPESVSPYDAHRLPRDEYRERDIQRDAVDHRQVNVHSIRDLRGLPLEETGDRRQYIEEQKRAAASREPVYAEYSPSDSLTALPGRSHQHEHMYPNAQLQNRNFHQDTADSLPKSRHTYQREAPIQGQHTGNSLPGDDVMEACTADQDVKQVQQEKIVNEGVEDRKRQVHGQDQQQPERNSVFSSPNGGTSIRQLLDAQGRVLGTGPDESALPPSQRAVCLRESGSHSPVPAPKTPKSRSRKAAATTDPAKPKQRSRKKVGTAPSAISSTIESSPAGDRTQTLKTEESANPALPHNAVEGKGSPGTSVSLRSLLSVREDEQQQSECDIDSPKDENMAVSGVSREVAAPSKVVPVHDSIETIRRNIGYSSAEEIEQDFEVQFLRETEAGFEEALRRKEAKTHRHRRKMEEAMRFQGATEPAPDMRTTKNGRRVNGASPTGVKGVEFLLGDTSIKEENSASINSSPNLLPLSRLSQAEIEGADRQAHLSTRTRRKRGKPEENALEFLLDSKQPEQFPNKKARTRKVDHSKTESLAHGAIYHNFDIGISTSPISRNRSSPSGSNLAGNSLAEAVSRSGGGQGPSSLEMALSNSAASATYALNTAEKIRDSDASGTPDVKPQVPLAAATVKKRNTAQRRDPNDPDQIRKAWTAMAKKDIPKMQKIVVQSYMNKTNNLRKIAAFCRPISIRLRQVNVKPKREVQTKLKKAVKETAIFWRKNEKEEKEARKKAEKEFMEQQRMEEEVREAKRSARKLNFLITQTELYSHFVASKVLGKSAEGATSGLPEAAKAIVGLPDLDVGKKEVVQMDKIDFAGVDDDFIHNQAAAHASQRLEAHREALQTFDHEAKMLREAGEHEANEAKKKSSGSRPSSSSTPVVEQVVSMDFKDADASQTKVIPQPKMLKCELKKYQRRGLSWLANLYEQGINGILADDMGLGKTVQSISLLAHLAETHDIWGPFLVISPASTLHNWKQEINRFVPEFNVLSYWGANRKNLRKHWTKKLMYTRDAPFHIAITSYQLIVTDEKFFNKVKWQYMILDEAHAIKSSASNRWKTLLNFRCRNRLLLTGTPIQNSMQELWALLHFIMPTLFDSHEEFSEWFSKDIESHAGNKGGSLNEHQLQRLHMILKPFMLRRVKADVELELAPKVEREIRCSLTPKQRRMYKGLKAQIKELDFESGDISGTQWDTIMNMRKLCNHPDLVERPEARGQVYLHDIAHTAKPLLRRGMKIPLVTGRQYTPLRFSLPKLIMEDAPRPTPSWFSFDLRYIHDRLNKDQDSSGPNVFGPLPLVNASAGDFVQLTRDDCLLASLQWLVDHEYRQSRPLNQKFINEDLDLVDTLELRLRPSAEERSPLAHLQTVGRRLLEDHIVMRCQLAYVPKAAAPQPVVACSSSVITRRHDECFYGTESKGILLNGYPFEGEEELAADESSSTVQSSNCKFASSYEIQVDGILPGIKRAPYFRRSGLSAVVMPRQEQLIASCGKMVVLDEMLMRFKAEDHRCLMYFQMTMMIDLMEEYLTYRKFSYLRLDGSTSIADRRDMVDDFQQKSDIFIFLLSTRAGGLGINLTAADTVIFYDSDWNPTADQQAMDRAHRLGQTKQVTVYRLITANTVEERILQRAREKHEIQRVVIQGGNFKDQEFKSREIVGLLLEEDDVEENVRKEQGKRKIAAKGGIPVIDGGETDSKPATPSTVDARTESDAGSRELSREPLSVDDPASIVALHRPSKLSTSFSMLADNGTESERSFAASVEHETEMGSE